MQNILKDKLWPDSYDYQRFKQREAYVWYTGDIKALSAFYRHPQYSTDLSFWGEYRDSCDTPRCHVDMAGDIAQTSASLLFAEPPIIRINKNDISKTKYTDLININSLYCIVSEAAELCAATGGVYIKLNSFDGHLDLEALPPHNIYPTFIGQKLNTVVCYTTIATDLSDGSDKSESYTVYLREYRHVENGNLVIDTSLIHASGNRIIDDDVGLSSEPSTAHINPKVVVEGYPHLGIVYVPNRKPNTVNSASPQGRSDYVKCYTKMEMLDETLTDWNRDIRLGKATNFIATSLLETTSSGDESEKTLKRFKRNTEAYVGCSMEQDLSGKPWNPITTVQAQIRASEFIASYSEIEQDIIRKAEYSIQSFGYEMKNYIQTGVAISKMERRTYLTMQKKQRYWTAGLVDLLEAIKLYGETIGISIPGKKESITIDFTDGSSSDLQVMAEAVRNLRQVGAMSVHSAVVLLNPDWTSDQVEEEVSRIKEEQTVSATPAGRDMNVEQQQQSLEDEAAKETQDV